MSVEQTTQLIQLILNSVLMSVACALVLGGLTARQTRIGSQLQTLNQSNLDRSGFDRLEGESGQWESAFPPVRSAPSSTKKYFRRLQQSYQVTHYSLLVAYYALFFSIASCFVLAFRGMVDWTWLIPVALVLFVLCMATLLVSLGLVLIDLHSSDRPLLEEVSHLINPGKVDTNLRSPMRSRAYASQEKKLREKNLREKNLKDKHLSDRNLRGRNLKDKKRSLPRQRAG